MAVVKLLLEAGVDPKTPGYYGKTALTTVLDSRWTTDTLEMVRALLENGARSDDAHPPRYTQAWYFMAKARTFTKGGQDEAITLEIMKFFLKAGADPNISRCWTVVGSSSRVNMECDDPPLVQVIRNGYVSIPRFLVKVGARPWYQHVDSFF